jgi:hypothetical protein
VVERTSWLRAALAVGLIGVFVAAGAHSVHAVRAHAATVGYPPVPSDARSARLLPAAAVGYGTAYVFAQTLPDGRPVTYDPCRPIHYVIDSTRLPAYGVKLVHEAVSRTSAATGLEFVDDGMTTETLSFKRPTVQARYGDRWAPVLIGFSDGKHLTDLGTGVMGLGGSVAVAPHGPASARYVTGTVALDQGDFDHEMGFSNGWEKDRAVVMHELGHVVGLAHSHDPYQLMYSENNGFTAYGSGDQAGLALEGAGTCHTDT